MEIEIDSQAGLCIGAAHAIYIAEEELSQNSSNLYCLGDLVHNNAEVARLTKKGLTIINHNQFSSLPTGARVIIRAYDELPSTYEDAQIKATIIDCTCPVISKFHCEFSTSSEEMKKVNGQLVLFGDPSHPEISTLSELVKDDLIILQKIEDLARLDYHRPISLFCQTTKTETEFMHMENLIRERISPQVPKKHAKVYNTLCGQVMNRKKSIESFAKKHDTILFISGAKSYNGQELFNVCRSINPHSFFLSEASEIHPSWFAKTSSVGVTGANSTPLWFIEDVVKTIRKTL